MSAYEKPIQLGYRLVYTTISPSFFFLEGGVVDCSIEVFLSAKHTHRPRV